MNILIIYAHPSTTSLNYAIKNTIHDTLHLAGHNVVIRDLYALNFNPVLTSDELNMTFIGNQAHDVIIEHEFIVKADKIIFIFPLWWGGMPAIMRGYLDRVLSYDFAYRSENGISVGLLKTKSVILINTIGSKENNYQQNGMTTALETIASHGIFNFCGAEVEKYFHFYDIHHTTLEERQAMLEQLNKYFSSLIA